MFLKSVQALILHTLLLFQKETGGVLPEGPSHESQSYAEHSDEASSSKEPLSSAEMPPSSDKLKNLGNDCYRQNRFEEALEYYSRAINLVPDEAKYYRNRGLCHERLNMYSASITDFSTALMLEPFNVRGRFSFGRLLYELGRYDEAVEHLQKALDYGDERYMSNDESYLIKTMLEVAHLKIEDTLKAEQKAQERKLLLLLQDLIIKDTERKITKVEDHIDVVNDEVKREIKTLKSHRDAYLKELTNAFDDYELPLGTSLTIPEYFSDKITYDIMRDPVVTPNGITYERAQIEKHLTRQNFEPSSRERLTVNQLRVNRALKTAIDDFMQKNRLTYRLIEEQGL